LGEGEWGGYLRKRGKRGVKRTEVMGNKKMRGIRVRKEDEIEKWERTFPSFRW